MSKQQEISTLTKADMVEQIVRKLNLTHQQGRMLVDSFFQELSNCLIEGNEVKLSGFGNFQLREKNARPGRNPKTGEDVQVSARRVVVFKSSQKLKDRMENIN